MPAPRPRSWTLWAGSRAFVLVSLVLLAEFASSDVSSDVRVDYFHAASRMFHGAVPYLDFTYEYPPGTLPFVALSWLLGGHEPTSFEALWVTFVLVLDAVVFAAVRRLASEATRPFAERVWIVGGVLTPWFLVRNDIVVVAAFAAGMVFLGRRPLATGATWAFAALAKLWPAAPLAAIVLARREGRGRVVAGAAAVGAVLVVVLGALGALRATVRVLVDYQGHRPLEIESTWANVRWLRAAFTGHKVTTSFTFGSVNIGHGHAETLATIGYDLTTAASVLLVVVAVALRRRARAELDPTVWSWLFTAYIALTLVLAPVFSPQYLTWLLAAAAITCALDDSRAAHTLATLALLAAAASTANFSFTFHPMIRGDLWAVIVLTIRNLAVVASFVVAVRRLRAVAAPHATVRATGRAEVPVT